MAHMSFEEFKHQSLSGMPDWMRDDIKDDHTFKVRWNTGGETGNCYGDRFIVEAEPEPEFEQLDRILETVCPCIQFLTYKRLVADVVKRDTGTYQDWYASCTEYCTKTFRLDELYRWLADNNLI